MAASVTTTKTTTTNTVSACASGTAVTICAGKDCRKATGFRQLCADLATCTRVEVRRTSCVDLCKSPVVVLDPDGDPVILERVRRPKQRRDLVRTLDGRPLSDRLKSLRVSGQRRKKVVRRLRRRAQRAATRAGRSR